MASHRSSRVCALAAVLGLALQSPLARSEEARPRVERIAAFKNGLGFVRATAILPKNATSVRFGSLPVPVLGTFWLEHLESVRLKSLQAVMESVSSSAPVQSLAEFLALNAGKRVTLHTSGGTIEGTVLVAAKEVAVENPSPFRTQPGIPGVVLLETGQGVVALNTSAVVRVDIPGKDTVTDAKVVRQVPVLILTLARPATAEAIGLTYLAKGFTWAPSYLIDITDPKTATFTAKATVINELADLDNVTLELVTGFPNIRFGDVSSPMDLKQSLSDFLGAVSGESSPWSRSSESRRPSILTQQAILTNVASRDAAGASFSASDLAQVEGHASEDLFFYSVNGFSLPKGGRAEVTLLSANLPYRHIYTWAIKDGLDESERRAGEPESAEEVWHSGRITNTLNMPFTTAPAQVMKEGRIAGQDICYYTPKGTETTIRINRALNLVAERAEIEVERKRNAETFHGSTYDLIKIKGELRLKSRLSQSARVEIRKELSGRLLSMQPEGKDTKTAQGLRRVNAKHVVVWEVDVNPGEEKKILYFYDVYVRS